MKALRKIFYILFLLLLALCLIGVGYYFAVTKGVSLQEEKLLLNDKSVYVYDNNAQKVENVGVIFQKQTALNSELPAHLKQAFIDVEDKRFYFHKGFDLKRMAKATLNNVKSHSYKEGASTISQQLIKNTHLTQEKTLKRKLKEWKLTRQLEKRYTKDQIIETYLNNIYFGHSCFGIRSASEFYFGKSPNELSLADSAILAGLIKSPNNYSPFKNPQNCQKRKESVLNCMLKNQSISEEEKRIALQTPLPTQRQTTSNKGYLHFVFDELTALAESQDFPVGGKIEIYTYLDQALQSNLEDILSSYSDSDKSAMVLDNSTHGFKACVSTIGNTERLPGSIIKPLLVYAPAMEENILSPATPILDDKVNYSGYTPENYDGKYHGYVSARECVEKSLNVPAVKVLSSLGVKKGAQYLQKLNLPVQEEDLSLALALGGMKKGYTLKSLIEGYSVFPNYGEFQTGGFISKIKLNGVTVYEKQEKKTRVFSSETSYLMTDILKSTAKQGTAKKLRNFPFDISAKTGTVGTKNGNTDAYALSYTAKDSVGVWIGNHDNRKIQSTGGGIPCNLLARINEYLYEGYQRENLSIPPFEKPSNIATVQLDKTSYYDTHIMRIADDNAPIHYKITELFKKDNIPTSVDTSFTKPTIPMPTISFKGGIVSITLDKCTPDFYEYKIEKYNYVTRNTYATHSTFSYDKKTKTFKDFGIEPNTQYVYTITPVYKNTQGNTLVLPIVSTYSTNTQKENIDDWWQK